MFKLQIFRKEEKKQPIQTQETPTKDVTLTKSYLGGVESRLIACEHKIRDLCTSIESIKSLLEEVRMGRKALEPLPYKPRISKLMKAILKELGQASGMRVSELTHSLKVPRPSISRSLSTLVRSGNATYTMEGKSRIYKLVEKKDSKQVTGD